MQFDTKASKSLLTVLLCIAAVLIYPALGRVDLLDDELKLAELAKQFSTSGVTNVFEGHGSDFVSNFYGYLVSLIINNFNIPLQYATRLPSAIVITLLTVALYCFQCMEDKLSKSFLSSILFLSSYTVIALAYHASTIALIVLPFIATLAILFLHSQSPSRNKAFLLVVFCATSTIFMGILAPLIIAILGNGFLAIKKTDEFKSYLSFTFYVVASVALAYGTIVFLTNDAEVAMHVLGVEQITSALVEYPKFEMFAGHVLFSIFPWSIPISISLFWIVFNPHWLKDRYMELSPYKRFGLIIFILSIPAFFVLNRLSLVMLLTVVFFNMPIISGFLLSQIHKHSIIWRITGWIFASAITIITSLFIATRSGLDIVFKNIQITTTGSWSIGSALLVIAIIISLYTLSRNQRTIKLDNRYLYNIVILYLLVTILYKAYINPFLISSF